MEKPREGEAQVEGGGRWRELSAPAGHPLPLLGNALGSLIPRLLKRQKRSQKEVHPGTMKATAEEAVSGTWKNPRGPKNAICPPLPWPIPT